MRTKVRTTISTRSRANESKPIHRKTRPNSALQRSREASFSRTPECRSRPRPNYIPTLPGQRRRQQQENYMMRNLVILILVGVVGESIAARAADVEVVAAVEGNRGPGWKAAANVMGAVGPNHIVDFTVAGFTVHDKATGKVLRHLSQREFWNKVEPAISIDPPKANDPWMVYDPLSQRWFATMAAN